VPIETTEASWAAAYVGAVVQRILPKWRIRQALTSVGMTHGSAIAPLPETLAHLPGDARGGAVEECILAVLRCEGDESLSDPQAALLPEALRVLGVPALEEMHERVLNERHAPSVGSPTPIVTLYPRYPADRTCFVIMPIGKTGEPGYDGYDERIYTELIPRAVEEADMGLTCIRADEISSQDSISQLIVEKLCRCRLAIADLTWPNPNVWYELGVRHSLCAPTLTMSQRLPLPFDTHDLKCETYTWPEANNDSGNSDFIQRMADRIRDALEQPPYQADNLMGRLLDTERDFWREHEARGPSYSPTTVLMRVEHSALRRVCERTLQCLFLALQLFMEDHDDCYPPGLTAKPDPEVYCTPPARQSDQPYSDWLSDLLRYTWLDGHRNWHLHCPEARGSYGYAMNMHLMGVRRRDVTDPARVPMCFDDTLRQDATRASAGPARHPGGNLVLYCDGHVRGVWGERLDDLKWHPEP